MSWLLVVYLIVAAGAGVYAWTVSNGFNVTVQLAIAMVAAVGWPVFAALWLASQGLEAFDKIFWGEDIDL